MMDDATYVYRWTGVTDQVEASVLFFFFVFHAAVWLRLRSLKWPSLFIVQQPGSCESEP